MSMTNDNVVELKIKSIDRAYFFYVILSLKSRCKIVILRWTAFYITFVYFRDILVYIKLIIKKQVKNSCPNIFKPRYTCYFEHLYQLLY